MTSTPPPDGRMAKWILLLTLLIALAARLAVGQEPEAGGPAGDLYERAKRASVEILVDDHLDGSGWFTDAEGLLFTAAHVIDRPDRRIEVLSPAVGRLDAKVAAVDLGHDLVLLRVEPREGGYPALKLGEKLPPPGQDVFLLGAPLFRHHLLLRGMVASDETAFGYYTGKYVESIHLAATVQSGTSGAPWLNRSGEVVALQSGVMSMNSIPIGVANAIPLAALRALLESRRTTATPTLGIAVEEPWQQGRDLLNRYPPRSEGLVVKILQDDKPAARAGLKQWDLIVAADDQKVRLSGELLRIVRGKRPGDPLKLTVLGPDGTGQREVTVPLGKLEVAWPPPEDAPD
ncbi:MAG: serine protease [Pirellulales bacterium]|nr:serine protease [Pirellulales bacterium]